MDQSPWLLRGWAALSAVLAIAGQSSGFSLLREAGLIGVIGAAIVFIGRWALSYIVNRLGDRLEIINQLPEKVEAAEARAVARDNAWKGELQHFNHRFDDLDAKLDQQDDKLTAAMALEKMMIDTLAEQNKQFAARLLRLEGRLFLNERPGAES